MNNNNYGFVFNDISIIDNLFIKKSKNSLGKYKINNEISFYLYIINNNIQFNMPNLIKHTDGEIVLEFIENSNILTYKIDKTNYIFYVNKIREQLNILHSSKINISPFALKKDLQIEIKTKIIDRYNEFNWISNSLFNSVTSVNNIKIQNISNYCHIIQDKIFKYLNERNYYNLIHGDTHLGNILIDENEKIYFIDPRGYFGETKLFGLYEYDYAKLLFGLSGYSVFDNINIDDLEITDNNLNINFIRDYEYIFESNLFDNITKLLCLSIWLGNNSCFINVNKKITSLMIAFYYCEKYLDLF